MTAACQHRCWPLWVRRPYICSATSLGGRGGSAVSAPFAPRLRGADLSKADPWVFWEWRKPILVAPPIPSHSRSCRPICSQHSKHITYTDGRTEYESSGLLPRRLAGADGLARANSGTATRERLTRYPPAACHERGARQPSLASISDSVGPSNAPGQLGLTNRS